jgi:mRNA deadenylase 3'-5' endonuclease subunit Ccr4
VFQWNILCNGLAFNSFDRVPDELVEWSYREGLIVQHILDINADVVCLQEMDKFAELMAKLGHIYEGHCAMKPDGMMGCAVLWKKDKIKRVSDFKSVQFLTEGGKVEN